MTKRIPQLDGLRGYCIIAVFLSHALKIRMLWIGVDVFFVLSGFLITGILLDMKASGFAHYIRQFYSRRARRILPPYILLLVVASILFGIAWLTRWYMYVGLTNYVEFFQPVAFDQFNALWSLGVEEQFYLIWPLAIFFLPTKKLPWITVALIVAAPVLRGIATPLVSHQPWNMGHWFIYKATPTRMDDLAMGALFTFLWRAHSGKVKKYGYLGVIVTLCTPLLMLHLAKLGGYSTFEDTLKANTVTYEIALFAAAGAFVWALGGKYIWTLNSLPLRWLGRISYSFYLIHQSALLVTERYIHGKYLIAVVAAAGSVLYAALSWYFMEKPILHGGKRRVSRLEVDAARAKPEIVDQPVR